MDGKRLASGGLDGKIRIWSIETLRKYAKLLQNSGNDDSSAVKTDPEECRELSSMSRHTGAVTCLRFSPNGRFLASGSDDRILLIWEHDEDTSRLLLQNQQQGLGNGLGSENTELEHWTVRKRLVAHDNDIQDMAWAPDSSILVTVGLDRSIIVWSGTTFEKIKRFDIHQSHVKGVVFDPANKYFATCSDDRTLRIFRYRRSSPTDFSFSVESVVTNPFKNTPLTTYYRRCSWSPDGQYIAAPNAVNGGMCSVAIVKRGSWKSDISLLGHELPCEVCSFSPRLYQIDGSGQKEPELTTVLVTGGQDRSLVLWDTASAVPLVVAHDLCMKTITDVAWDPSGQLVFLSSLDGSVTAVFFDQGELGRPIPLDQNSAQLHRYGADRESMYFPESVEQLQLEEAATKFSESHPAHKRMDKLMGDQTHEGFVSSGFPSIPSTANIMVNTLVPRSKKHPNRRLPVTVSKKKPILTASSQKVQITKSGKRRLTPMLISTTSAVTKPTVASQKKHPKSTPKFLSHPSLRMPRLGLQTMVSCIRDNLIYEKSKGLEDSSETDIDHITGAQAGPKKRSSSRSQYSRRKRSVEYPSYMTSCITTPFTVFTDMKNQPSIILQQKPDSNGDPFGSVMEIRNESDERDGNNGSTFDEFDSISKLFVTNGQKTAFQYFKNDKVTNVTESKFGSVDYWALSTDKGSIIILSKTGRQLRPSIELGSSLTHLISRENFLLTVTNNGLVYSWDLESGKIILEGVSLAPIVNQFAQFEHHKHKFENNAKILELHLFKNGLPLILLSNDYIYLFDADLCCWVNVLEPWYLQTLSYDELKQYMNSSNRLLRVLGARILGERNGLRTKTSQCSETIHSCATKSFAFIQKCFQERAENN
ncbi:hypothetical protein FOA43_002086 [Brettanomyces nanus]|uniref:Protein HIR n=1 Tax=Eeniella nana TaxID=13502 RepID=A0A875S1G3_EENNA|nr:uncharacterized protein FOA43_002086 [Brettanomyces nanus]QPG74753.1 hypothetical protein FOA43_002086 [Brettanomyces nanus]